MNRRRIALLIFSAAIFSCGGASKQEINTLEAQAQKIFEGQMMAGKGIGESRIGMTLEQMTKVLGDSKQMSPNEHKHFVIREFGKTGVIATLLKGKTISMSLSKGSIKTADGIGLGSDRGGVEAIYGPPPEGWPSDDSLEDTGVANQRHVYDAGISFSYKSDVVNSMTVYTPQMKTAPDVELVYSSEKAPLSEVMGDLGLPMAVDGSKLVYRCLSVGYNEEGGTVTAYERTLDSWSSCK